MRAALSNAQHGGAQHPNVTTIQAYLLVTTRLLVSSNGEDPFSDDSVSACDDESRRRMIRRHFRSLS